MTTPSDPLPVAPVRGKPRAPTDAQITTALKKCHGRVGEAAKVLGVTVSKLNSLMTEDHRDVRLQWYESITDTAEEKLAALVISGDKIACLFWLKCHGKKRGWVERQEHQVAGAVIHQVAQSDGEKGQHITALLAKLAIGSPPSDSGGEPVHSSEADGGAT